MCKACLPGTVRGVMRCQTPIALVAATLLVASCKQEPPPLKPVPSAKTAPIHRATPATEPATAAPKSASAGTLPPGHPPVGGSASQPAPAGNDETVQGEIKQTIDAGKYLYLELDRGTATEWAAVLKADVKIGDVVRVANAHRMRDFQSKSLNRTFESIWFGTLGGVKVAAEPSAPAPAPAQPTAKIDPEEGGLEIAEVFARAGELAGKAVTVRGKVVKFNAAIMDRNWVHLKDGSGSAASGDDDLLVTTKHPAEVGQTITARGTVAIDRDFGHGYSYRVLVEDATLR